MSQNARKTRENQMAKWKVMIKFNRIKTQLQYCEVQKTL